MHLTKTEIEITKALSKGYTQPEIAEFRCRSVETVKKHVKNALHKLGAKNAAHLVAITKDLGLIAVLFGVTLQVLAPYQRANDDPLRDVDMRRGRLVRSFRLQGRRVREDEV